MNNIPCDDSCSQESSLWKQLKDSISKARKQNYKQVIDMMIDSSNKERKRTEENQSLANTMKCLQQTDKDASEVQQELQTLNQDIDDLHITKNGLIQISECQEQKICTLEGQVEEAKSDADKVKAKCDAVICEVRKKIQTQEAKLKAGAKQTGHAKDKLKRRHDVVVSEQRRKNATQVKVDALEYNMNKAKDSIDLNEDKDRQLTVEVLAVKSQQQADKKKLESQLKECEETSQGMAFLSEKLNEAANKERNLKCAVEKAEETVSNLQSEIFKIKQEIKKSRPTIKILERETAKLNYDIELAERDIDKHSELVDRCRKCGKSVNPLISGRSMTNLLNKC